MLLLVVPILIINFKSALHLLIMPSNPKLLLQKKIENFNNKKNMSLIQKKMRSTTKGNSRWSRKIKKPGYFTGERRGILQAEPTYLWTLLKMQEMKLERLFGRILVKLYMGQYKIQRGKKVMMIKILILKIF